MQSRRRVLCVFPRCAPSFGTLHHAYPLVPGVKAFMPPQGLLVVAAALPARWDIRFVDLNCDPLTDEDLGWAEAVLVSGMHIQRHEIQAVGRRARALGRLTVLGGPSVSATPERYPGFDVLNFWRLAGPALLQGDIEPVVHAGVVGSHIIRFARECGAGTESASF